jgi:2-oxoglutarate ferredoxin oxidoreductase subunit gamma
MQTEIIFSGFGGQGALFAGQLLAHAAADHGRQVTWIPSYGPEMRGGTAHCTVIVSDEPIGSPMVRRPGVAVTLNQPSFDKYQQLVKPGGLLVYNRSLVSARPSRTDIRYLPVPGNDIGEQVGSARMANVALLGAMLAATGIVPLEAVEHVLDVHLSDRQRKFLAANKQALALGAAIVTRDAQPLGA